MTESQSVKPCNQCEHHYSIGNYNYCTFHTIPDTNVVTGEVSDIAILCRFARQEEYCGMEARNYVHRGPEPPISFLSHVKNFLELMNF